VERDPPGFGPALWILSKAMSHYAKRSDGRIQIPLSPSVLARHRDQTHKRDRGIKWLISSFVSRRRRTDRIRLGSCCAPAALPAVDQCRFVRPTGSPAGLGEGLHLLLDDVDYRVLLDGFHHGQVGQPLQSAGRRVGARTAHAATVTPPSPPPPHPSLSVPPSIPLHSFECRLFL